ncbi:U8 snoRNA-decapping enzyme-like [Dermacentor albipictus]|uniref:U8 snoRNA-decapping enzyme-like n=1 Tax=Dermacentor albipictus TaxID=60249 RepID=UPI0031FE0C4F
MDKAEPEKHPLDLSIVRNLNLNQNGFEACGLSEALATGYRNAAHAMLWAPADVLVMQRYQQKATILAVVRFDGYLGFPGGLVDPGESPAQAVNRELREELNADTSRFWATEGDHVISFRQQERRFACHFYALRVSADELLATERAAIGSREHGHETLGILRVPLYTMADGVRGLPVFLAQRFAGTAREQLLYAAVRLGLLDEAAARTALGQSETALAKSR